MTSQSLPKLVYMANQIANAFRTQARDKAAEATYDHLWHFWDPRMRAIISAHEEAGGEGLNEIARAAVRLLIHTATEPQPATKATEFSGARDPDLMSDAG